MRALMLLCAALALMWMLPLPARSQTAAGIEPVTFVDLLGGKTLALSMKFKELDGEWRTFTSGGDAAGFEQFFMMIAMSEGMPFSKSAYYTRGRTITIGTETFLVAYRQEQEPFDFRQAMMGRGWDGDEMPEAEPLTPETTLHLSLLNLRTLGAILDIKPFDMEKEMTAGQLNSSGSRLRQLVTGIIMYAQDNDELLPAMDDRQQLMRDIDVEEEAWKHPVTGEIYGVNAGIGGMALGEIEDPTEIVVCYEATPWPDGKRHAAFLDGHVALLSEAEWAELKKKAELP